MNEQNPTLVDVLDPEEQAVADYLLDHPDFFEKHATFFSQIKIPHTLPTGTTSLIERQVDILRQQNQKLERRLTELIDAGRGNDRLLERLHRVALYFLELEQTHHKPPALEKLASLLAVDAVMAALWAKTPQQLETFRVLEARPSSLLPDHWGTGHPYCGRMGDTLGEHLFGARHTDLRSVALIALGYPDAEVGFIALGLADPDHFRPGLGTQYLNRLGELVSVVLGMRPPA
ncbi:protein containing DUF484 [mine drainage metagenome]|uniref:Protein containing DUF484 n=1 Tax=mine drainage metagenome TaxID=410659 RepID=T1C2Q8_9ZZZZ